MDRGRLPQNSDLYIEGDYWNLRWREDSIDAGGCVNGQWLESSQIGPATGPNGLTEREAQRIAWKQFLSLMQQNAISQHSQMTIANFVESKFVPEHVAIKRPSGRTHYQAMLKHVLNPEQVERVFGVDKQRSRTKLKAVPDWPYLDNLRLCDARTDHVQQLTSAALARGYSTQTVTHIRNVVSAIFSHAQKEQCFMGDNPASSVRLPEMTRKEAHALTPAQAKEVIGEMKYPEKEMSLFTLITGMNVAEICGLQWRLVNLTDKVCNIDKEPIPPKTIAVRKQWYRGELAGVKASRIRNLPIPGPLLPLLIQLSRRARFVGPDDFVLVSRVGTPINQINIVARRLKPIGKKLQMPWLSWHVFRRAHTSLATESGIRFKDYIAMLAGSDAPKHSTGYKHWNGNSRQEHFRSGQDRESVSNDLSLAPQDL